VSLKNFLGILVLGLLWCNVGFAITQQQFIDQHLKGRKLDTIEGVWMSDGGRVFGFYKSGSQYLSIIIKSTQFRSGETADRATKGSNNVYYGTSVSEWSGGWSPKIVNMSATFMIQGNTLKVKLVYGNNPPSPWMSSYRLWPNDINSHNAKFEKKKEKKKDKFTPSSGTAFFVTQKGHVITNFHVVEGCKGRSKIVYQDKEIKVKLLAKDKYLDLALLKADIKNKHFIKISNKSPKKLQRIIAAGYPFGKELSDDLKFTSGIVSSLKGLQDDSTRIQIDAALNYGNSGGPIVDEKTGELVAVAVAGLSKEVTESINFGIKAGSVINFLDSNQINTSLLPKNFGFGSVDLSAILENATVYTFCN